MRTPEIIDFAPRYADAFARLNLEWLERYFRVEPLDHFVLSDPEANIIEHGGVILFARSGSDIVGTVALIHHGEGIFELSKMAVAADRQGAGIGRDLLSAAIARYESIGGSHLYLESHSSLAAALGLYESAGFVHEAPPSASEYARADVYMVYRPG